MIGIIVTGHGKFADGIQSALKVIAGEQEAMAFVNFDDDSTTLLEEKLQMAMDSFSTLDGILVLSDLTGGSPFKLAVECAHKNNQNIEVIGGINLPMVIELSVTRQFVTTLEELTNIALTTGKDNIIRFTAVTKKKDEDGDGI